MAKNPQGWFQKNPPSQRKGEGPYAGASDDFKLTQVDTPRFSLGRDISKLVDRNRTDGFSAKLDETE